MDFMFGSLNIYIIYFVSQINQLELILNALVQKATYFLKKSKVAKNEECTVTVKTAIDQ